VLMKDYSKEFRALTCWECFVAEGKMCSNINDDSLLPVTGSDNDGHGACCKPDSTVKECVSNGDY
jgi:hypothetical protein